MDCREEIRKLLTEGMNVVRPDLLDSLVMREAAGIDLSGESGMYHTTMEGPEGLFRLVSGGQRCRMIVFQCNKGKDAEMWSTNPYRWSADSHQDAMEKMRKVMCVSDPGKRGVRRPGRPGGRRCSEGPKGSANEPSGKARVSR